MMTQYQDKKFWADAIERVIRTAAQSAIAAIGTTAVVQEINWKVVAGTTGVSALLALLTAFAAKGSGDPDSASFQEGV